MRESEADYLPADVFYADASPVKRFQNCFRIPGGYPQESMSRSFWLTSFLLPVLNRARTDTNQCGEFGLTQLKAGANFPDIWNDACDTRPSDRIALS